MVDQSSSMAVLPSHIRMEIISRLPIKTVMAIRCVCKSLLGLVSDSHFQTLHSTRAPTEIMFSGWTKSSKTLCIAEYVFVDDSLTAVDTKSNVVFELPNFSVTSENCCIFGGTKGSIVSLVNSCCGLVCFKGPYHNRFVVVCNPFTREYITFPCPAMMDKTVERQGICYGLGFSPKDNCFKLLRLFCRKKVGTDYVDEKIRLVGEIYTFGERVSSWKRVANRPGAYLGQEKVIFHEGVLHWYCTSRGGSIGTFDFDTELFGKLATPICMSGMSESERRWPSAVSVFENCLCISDCVGDFVDTWMLKEYGQGSWIKRFSIRKDVKSPRASYEPLKYLQNGEVLMFKKQGDIVCFNPDTGSVKKVGGLCGRDGAVFIRPSLVSLKVLLGDNAMVHSVKPWHRTKADTIPHVWTSSVVVEDVVNADKDSQGCLSGSSAPRSSSEASASTSHPTKVKENAGCFGSQYPRPPKDRRAGQSSCETQKLADEIETLHACPMSDDSD